MKTYEKSLPKIISFCVIFLTSNNLLPNNWEEHFINDTVKIEFPMGAFSSKDQELVVFRFTNLTNENINLSYSTKIWNNNKEVNLEQNSEEILTNIRLLANEIKISDCENNNKEYTIFSGFVHNKTQERYQTLTKFELTNIITENE